MTEVHDEYRFLHVVRLMPSECISLFVHHPILSPSGSADSAVSARDFGGFQFLAGTLNEETWLPTIRGEK